MHERDNRDGLTQVGKRGKRAWLIAILLALLAVGGWLLWAAVSSHDSRTADERLAEIEAARAIPDSENAATIYKELLRGQETTSILDDLPEAVETPALERGLYEPWSSTDHPARAAWVQKHRVIADRLGAAARFEQCRFPLRVDILDDDSVDRFAPMCAWEYLLNLAASNDVAEQRIDAALDKWRCLVQLANHLRQQPLLLDHANANHLPTLALESMARFIIAGDPTETHLQTIETLPLPLADNWATYLQQMQMVDDLQTRKSREQYTPGERLRSRLRSAIRSVTGKTRTSAYDEVRNAYFGNVAQARVVRIFVALKRHRKTAGYWPRSLDEIRLSLPEEIVIDPLNGGPFIYRHTTDAFSFYSRGYNGIDENGDSTSGDDWPIWPPRDRTPEPELRDANDV